MIVVIMVFGATVASVLAAFLGGLMLPRFHEVTRAVRVPASLDTVWQLVANPTGYATWRDRVTAVDLESDTPLRWREYTDDGPLDFEASLVQPPTTLRVQRRGGAPLPAERDYRLQADGDGTRVEYAERLPMPNPLKRFIARYLLSPAEIVDQELAALSAAARSVAQRTDA